MEDFSEDDKSPTEYREDLFNALCGEPKPVVTAANILPPKAQCPVCNKWFRDKTRVHEHLNVHYGARPLNCNVCGTNFAARSNLIKHSQQHHAPFACHMCGCGPFSDIRLLGEHTRHEHPELHRFACHLCDASFSRQADLSEHLISHPPALLEVRRRKRATDSPNELLSDADDSNVKRKRTFVLNSLANDATMNAGGVELSVKDDAYSAAAFFGLDAAALKHASVEELASHISKLSNLAANLQQNGVLNALAANAAPFALGFTDAPLHSASRSESGANCKSDSLSSSANSASNVSCAQNTGKLPSILLRKQASLLRSGSPLNGFANGQQERDTNGQETVNDHNGDLKQKANKSNGDGCAKNTSGSSEIGVQCSLPDDQTASMSPTTIPPCQRDMFVFQQLLTKLISRGELFRCQHCEVIFFERGIYCLHRSLHDEHNPFQCAICGKRCTNKDNFTLHFVNQKHQTGGCTGACAPLSPDAASIYTNGH